MSRYLFLAALLWQSACAAQTVFSAELTGQPLQYMKDGVVNGCGIRIVALRPMGGRVVMAIDVSINVYASGAAIFQAGTYDAELPVGSSKKGEPLPVASAWIKAQGAVATKPVGRSSMAAADKVSLIYVTELESALAVFRAQARGEPVQVSVTRRGSDIGSIFAGPVTLDASERAQLGACLGELGGPADQRR